MGPAFVPSRPWGSIEILTVTSRFCLPPLSALSLTPPPNKSANTDIFRNHSTEPPADSKHSTHGQTELSRQPRVLMPSLLDAGMLSAAPSRFLLPPLPSPSSCGKSIITVN